MPDEGLVSIRSAYSVQDTIARLEADLAEKGAAVFAKINHAEGAAAAGLALRSPTMVIFGGARAGTPLMQACQCAGIELPLKALVWEDGEGKVWLTYNDPAWVARRHAHGSHNEAIAQAISAMLAAIAHYSTGAGPDFSGERG